MIPFIGTTLGASAVFFMKGKTDLRLRKALLGFASGVMVAASIWSLLVPSMDAEAARGGIPWIPAVVGFLFGMIFMMGLDALVPRICAGKGLHLGPSAMLVLAVTLHNLPEGMAVGVVFSGMADLPSPSACAEAFVLAVGIAVQNIPEGAIISAPLAGRGASRFRAFALGSMSGAVEPLGALLTLVLTSAITPILPYILAFAAGTMIYVVFEELVPELHEGGRSFFGVSGVAVGFALMMLLDAALG